MQNAKNTVFSLFFLSFACRIREKALPLHSQKRKGAIAQLVEQRTDNPCVPGSIPGGTTEEKGCVG